MKGCLIAPVKMISNPRTVWRGPHPLPTAEELAKMAIETAHKYLGNNVFNALVGCMSELGVFDKSLRERASRILRKQSGSAAEPTPATATSRSTTHASHSAEALERLEDTSPVIELPNQN